MSVISVETLAEWRKLHKEAEASVTQNPAQSVASSLYLLVSMIFHLVEQDNEEALANNQVERTEDPNSGQNLNAAESASQAADSDHAGH